MPLLCCRRRWEEEEEAQQADTKGGHGNSHISLSLSFVPSIHQCFEGTQPIKMIDGKIDISGERALRPFSWTRGQGKVPIITHTQSNFLEFTPRYRLSSSSLQKKNLMSDTSSSPLRNEIFLAVLLLLSSFHQLLYVGH